jgi:hypothetical protein
MQIGKKRQKRAIKILATWEVEVRRIEIWGQDG